MSTPTKLRAGTNSELTRLKALWRDTLSEDAKSYWQELFISPDVKQSQIRQQILTRLKINLRFDKQLNQFRDWELDQRDRDLQAERMLENERRLKTEHPDWSLDQVRAEVLRQSYLETLATGNFKLGLAARKSDIAEQALKFDRDKFEFDAAKAALKCAATLKLISNNKNLSEADKVNAARTKLFGELPK